MTSETIGGVDRFEYLAGSLCLDFLNTCSTHDPVIADDLRTYTDLLDWCTGASIFSPGEAAEQRQSGESNDAIGLRELQQARDIREALYRIFDSHMRDGGASVARADVETLHAALGNALAAMRTRVVDGAIEYTWRGRPQAPGSLLWPVVVDAARLLTSAELARIAKCGGEGCDWLFIVNNRGRRRRWCSMSGCGNRAKAKRHYEKSKSAREALQG
jgi:predicted RNA-binding Zn ribbon-like protein